MTSYKIILNPVAGRGHAGRSEHHIRTYLGEAGLDYDLVHTRGVLHAAELAEQAVVDGFDVVVAAGGDGTSNEVVNGMLAKANSASLGVLPVGTGSDFANTVGISPDLRSACLQLANGVRKKVDVGKARVSNSTERYFVNALGIGFEGILTIEARKIKYLRGMALYLPAVLKTVFVSFRVPQVQVSFDGQRVDLSALMVCIANGPREGGGFFVAPDALPDDGMFDVCLAESVSKLRILGLLPHFMKGTHIHQDTIKMLRTHKVAVTSSDDLAAHMDGELLCVDSHSIECEILQHRISVKC